MQFISMHKAFNYLLEDKEDKFEENKGEEVQEEDKKEETSTNEETAGE